MNHARIFFSFSYIWIVRIEIHLGSLADADQFQFSGRCMDRPGFNQDVLALHWGEFIHQLKDGAVHTFVEELLSRDVTFETEIDFCVR